MPETAKHRSIVAPYCIGNGVDLGCTPDAAIVPWAIQVNLPEELYRRYNNGKTNTNVHWKGDARELPFKNRTLDWVHSSHLIEDFESWSQILEEWDRVLRVGGYMIISVPDRARFRAAVAAGQGDNLSHKHESHIGEIKTYFPNHETIYDGFVSDNPLEYSLLYIGKKVS